MHHKKGRRQTVENVKYAVNSQLSCASAGVQGDPKKKKLQKIIPHISYLKPIDTLKNILLQKWSALLGGYPQGLEG